MSADTAQQAAKHGFQTEVARLLHLMVHSVYTEKDVFLRELISNASDACDKLRYEAIAKPELLGDDAASRRSASKRDKAAGTLTVADNGIGMDEQELIDNLGTIARSGTRAFLERLSAGRRQLVADRPVRRRLLLGVHGRRPHRGRRAARPASSSAWLWVSDGASGLHGHAGAGSGGRQGAARDRRHAARSRRRRRASSRTTKIERIVRAYSDHILFPVELAGDDGKTRQINSASALWQRSKSEVKPEEYKEVYNTLAHQFDEPALTLHYRAEGRQSYAVLLFVPTRAPFDLFDAERKGRVKLYVRRVFITEDAQLLPAYLRFVRGVIDSEDVPLNISPRDPAEQPAGGADPQAP